jgi:hypothetical protein
MNFPLLRGANVKPFSQILNKKNAFFSFIFSWLVVRKLEVGSGKLEVGSGEMEDGSSKKETENRQPRTDNPTSPSLPKNQSTHHNLWELPHLV